MSGISEGLHFWICKQV